MEQRRMISSKQGRYSSDTCISKIEKGGFAMVYDFVLNKDKILSLSFKDVSSWSKFDLKTKSLSQFKEMRQIALIIATGLVIATIYYGFREMQKVHIRLDHMSKVIERLEESRSDLEGKLEFQKLANANAKDSLASPSSVDPNLAVSQVPSNNSNIHNKPQTAPTQVSVSDTHQQVNQVKPTSEPATSSSSRISSSTTSVSNDWNIETALAFWKGYNEGTESFQPAISQVFQVFSRDTYEGKPLEEPILLKEELVQLLEAVGQCDTRDITEDEVDIVFNQFDRNQSGAVEFSDFLYTMALRRQKNMGLDTPPPLLRQQNKADEMEDSSDNESCDIDPESVETGVPADVQEQINNLHPIPTVVRDENEVDSLADDESENDSEEEPIDSSLKNIKQVKNQTTILEDTEENPEENTEENPEENTEHTEVEVEQTKDLNSVGYQEGDVASVDSLVVSSDGDDDGDEENQENQTIELNNQNKLENTKENLSEDSDEKVMIQEPTSEQENHTYTDVFLESLTVKELKELAKKKSIPTNKRRKGELITMIMSSSV